MVQEFICEVCGQKYTRPTYTATSTKQTKEFWREKEGTVFGKCYDCYKKEQEEMKKKASEEANLPELSGSGKQVDWASKIRFEKYEQAKPYMKGLNSKGIEVYDRLFGMTEARFWIDNRDKSLRDLMAKVASMAPVEVEAEIKAEEEKEKQAKKEVQKKSVLQPENPADETPVEIKIGNDSVAVISKKDDRIINICKELSYEWKEGTWRRSMTYRTGSAIDRAAEIGNKLLSAGFPVLIENSEAVEKAVNATFEPEYTRWISISKVEPKRFFINWKGRDNRIYETAKSLPKAKWVRPNVEVSIKYFREVEEFAELMGFRFSPGAQKAIKEYKESLEVKQVNPGKAPEIEHPDGLKKILESDNNIIEDLKD